MAQALQRVAARLHGIGTHTTFYPTIGSTNDVASALASRGECHGAVVVGDEQTSGRGRRGRSWYSPPGSGLYVSVVLSISQARVSPDRATALVTLAAGVALAEAIETTTGLRVDIKWPNDLHVERRKLAGILAEGILGHRAADAAMPAVDQVVLGYGINVGPMAYPPELRDRATSLESELGRPVDRSLLFAETLARIAARHQDLVEGRFDAILEAWRARAPFRRYARVRWETSAGSQSGVPEDIDQWGALIVRTESGIERLIAGEIHWE